MNADANAQAIEAWNTVLFEKFSRFRYLLTHGFGIHGLEALRRHPPAEGARVLDIGCGWGDTTIDIAGRVGPRGGAVGVDAAARFVDEARLDAERTHTKNARFLVADVQSDDLGGPYDLGFSRFGTMFFASPVAALRNVRRSLRPGKRLLMVVWRRREDNQWLYAAEVKVRELVPESLEGDEPTCGPGPFSMAGADTVSDMLAAAGYEQATFERYDADICIGRDLDEAVDFAMAIGPAGEILRLAGSEADALRPRVLDVLRDVLSTFEGPSGVIAPSSTWLISAQAP